MHVASWLSAAALSTLLAGSAEAMPTPAPYHADASVTLVAGGCGAYYHRNVYGACVPNGWGGGVVVAPGFYGGPGWHGGYYGGGWHGGGWHGGYYHGGGWHGGGWHGGGWHGGGWHGGGWHGTEAALTGMEAGITVDSGAPLTGKSAKSPPGAPLFRAPQDHGCPRFLTAL